jgi:radical SAM superfamily enzyme YgiQ (UPF0313 family)
MADIVLINPKFEISFWGLEHALPIFGKRAIMPVSALPLLAALTPAEHRITLIDENVEPIDFDRCSRADIVGVTGMVVQRQRMREITIELKRRGVYTVVGGPWITVKQDYFDGLADVIFVGEAEESWPRFLADWHDGRAERRYEQKEQTDMSRVPTPRFDLLKMNRYAFGALQFSRGCPFLCEFCDIIVIFGRRPRIKSVGQIIAELEALRARKQTEVFIVDDNFIGNKKAVKQILAEIITWQRANGYPLAFFTEASLDLADDDELMRLMVDANIGAVFVGIESPNEESLRETRKLQNVRASGTMVEKVHRIQQAGMEVWAGMIVGFDNDDETIFAGQHRFLDSARINTAMVGMLSAIPSTPLHARLLSEGRLDPADNPAFGTNVVPLRMSREALSNGYVQLMADLYHPQAFFKRVDDLFLAGKFEIGRAWQSYAAQHPWQRSRRHFRLWCEAFGILARLLSLVPDRSLRRLYRRQFWRFARNRRNPTAAKVYAMKCAVHYHMYHLVHMLEMRNHPLVNTF